MKKVVITGGTGLIGNGILRQCLKEGIETLVFVRPGSEHQSRIPNSPLVTKVELDISQLEEVDVVTYGSDWEVFYHMAWDGVGPKERNDAKLQLTNIAYTLGAVKAACRLGCNVFIGAGSQAEYGSCKGKITEETPVNPQTAYGIAKYAAGRLSMVLCKELEMRHIWGRVFSVYGKYDRADSVINYVIEELLCGRVPKLTSGKQIWDYMHSDEVGRVFVLLGTKDQAGGVYCISKGELRTLRSYLEEVRDCINPRLKLGFGEVEGRVAEQELNVEIKKLQKDTGFQSFISFKEGIEQIVAVKKREVYVETVKGDYDNTYSKQENTNET